MTVVISDRFIVFFSQLYLGLVCRCALNEDIFSLQGDF